MNQTTNELNAALRQLLRGFKEAGLETVPRGQGRFGIDLQQLPTALPSESVSVGKVATPEQVSERRVEYRVDPASNLDVEAGLKQVAQPIEPASGSLPRREALEPTLVDLRDYPPSLKLTKRQLELDKLTQQAHGCQKCAELARCRNRVVFGTGNITPRLVFLGEAPGADEDLQGEPFVGASGQLLNKIIGACKLNRTDVYILNTIKCRPPGNRNPATEELENCWSITERQLEVLRPEFICCLGLVATRQLLKSTQPLGRMRQQFHRYRESKVVVTYHPSYLLRTESAKKFVWEDMKMLLQAMGLNNF